MGLASRIKEGEKKMGRMFKRKSKGGSNGSEPSTPASTPPSTPSAASASPGAAAAPPKAFLDVPAPPKQPGGAPSPDLNKVSNVKADQKPTDTKAGEPGARTSAEQTDPTGATGSAAANGTAAPGAGPKLSMAGAEAAATASPLLPTPDDKLIPASTVVLGLLAIGALGFLLVIELFPPRWGELTLWAALFGLPVGLGLSFWKHKNEQHKAENIEKLNVYPGLKGLKEMLGSVPSWIHYEERERVEWLNSVLTQMWPFYDPAICEAVKQSVEPLLDAYKPPGLIKRIYFRTLTFGDAPFRIDNVWVDKSNEKEVVLEMAFRWAGQANIALAIEPIVSLGTALRMVPNVSNLRVNGVVRVMLKPLVDDVPVVNAMIIALKAPPQIHFTLEVGKQVGGALIVKPIMLWLDPFLRHTLTDLLVWPNRVVVPITADPAFDITTLEMRNVGLLTVEVVEAKGLKKMDLIGKSDPFVELSTLPLAKEKTATKKKTLSPQWHETKHVMVQEPSTQFLRVEMYDHDVFQPKELLNLNIIKGASETIGSQELMGRAMVYIKEFADAPCQEFDKWIDLGKGEWSNPDGCGQGEGELHLKITYTPFDMMGRHPSESATGSLLLRLVKGDEMPAADEKASDPYCTFKLGKAKEQKSYAITQTLQPVWNQKFEWRNVSADETLDIKCYDEDRGNDDLLGTLSFPLRQKLREMPADATIGSWSGDFRLENVFVCNVRKIAPPATLTMKIEWIPYTYQLTDSEAEAAASHGGRLHGLFHHKHKSPNVVEGSESSITKSKAEAVATHNDVAAVDKAKRTSLSLGRFTR